MNILGDAGSSNPLAPDNKSGVWGQSDSGHGVAGTSYSGNGVQAGSVTGIGAVGTSDTSTGVVGISAQETGVYGRSDNVGGYGVHGENTARNGVGIRGSAAGSLGVGVLGHNSGGAGVQGLSSDEAAVVGISDRSYGVEGASAGSGFSGVTGSALGGFGVVGYSADPNFAGVQGIAASGTGVEGASDNVGVMATNNVSAATAWLGTRSNAGDFHGNVWVSGNLHKAGGGFRIDHPLDPSEQYLSHSFVESSERKNVYDGRVDLDGQGRATIVLPDWLSAVNQEFRYQLTAMHAASPNLHVSKELTDGRFEIAGGTPGSAVCWQLTGIRKDRWALANPMNVESPKSSEERGYYVNADVYGESPGKSVLGAIHRQDRRDSVASEGRARILEHRLNEILRRRTRMP